EWTSVHAVLGLQATESYASARQRLPDPSDDHKGLGATIAASGTEDIARHWHEAGVPCCEPAVVVPGMLPNDEFKRLCGMVRYQHPRAGGDVFEVGHMVRFSESTFRHTRPFPALGENTTAILREIGLSEVEIGQMLARGIAFQSKT